LPQYLRRDAELQAARSDAASRLAGLQEETDHLQAAGRAASAPAAPAPDPARTALEGQIKAAKERLEELRQRYTDLYPDVEEANGNLASLEARLKAMPAAKPVVEMPKPVLHTAELNTLAAQESDLRNQIGTLDSQIDANQQETGVLRQRLAGAQNLKQQYSVEQQRYKTLLQVQEALDVDGQAPASSGNAPLFTIVKSATSADALGWMFDPLFWIASLALALLASGLSVYLAEQFAPAVHEHMPSRSFYPS
jgi:chromosome segregation ATPase